MTTLFPPAEFDSWAAEYDEDVYSDSGFPFEGYASILQAILDQADPRPNSSVLDLGIGTGNLAQLFRKRDCEIWGLDFSAEMLTKARIKLPSANLEQADITAGWPSSFLRQFDYVVSAYTFHHFPLNEKVRLVQDILTNHLSPDDQLIIGDVAFKDADEQKIYRDKLGDEWEEEYYWLVNETLGNFAILNILSRFIKISYCAGIFIFPSR
jgi:putative AdoMet-dependent methyltransferase